MSKRQQERYTPEQMIAALRKSRGIPAREQYTAEQVVQAVLVS